MIIRLMNYNVTNIQRDNIGDAWGFSGETLTEVWLCYRRPSGLGIWHLDCIQVIQDL